MSNERGEAAAIAGVVDRPRLYRLLDSPLMRVCVVQGPSGCGKTTLLRSWAFRQGQRQRVTWVSLNDSVTSSNAFWQHLAGSASRLGDLSPETAARVKEQLSLAADPVRVASMLLADAGPVVLVVDAYEHVGDVMPEIDEDLARLVAAAPDLRLMVTTRSHTGLADLDPPGGVVRVVTLSELALTPEEVGALITEQTGLEDERLAASVATATRGFALTVRAVVLTLSQLGRIPRAGSAEWNAVLAARLESLLPDQEAVRFVTDTSVPPYVDVELGGLLSGNPQAAALLGMLERNGFGRWIPYARQRPVFQYVETIRDTFRARAADDPERFRRSCVAAAGWMLENEEVDQALQLAIDGGDHTLADRVFVSLVIGNPDSYITDRFLPALRKVPEDALSQYPMLAFGLGLALMANPMLRLEAPRVFQIAIDSTSRPAYVEPAIDAFTHASMRLVAQRLATMRRATPDASREVLRLLEAVGPDVLALFGEHVGTILRQLSFSIWQDGRIEEALATANRSVALCTRPAPRNYSVVYTAAINAFAGDTAAARVVVASVDAEAWPPETRRTSMNGLGLLAEAYIRLDAHDFAGAEETLRDARPYLRTNEYWPFLTAAWVLVKHGIGQAHAAADRVTRALTGPTTPPGVGDNVASEHLHAVLARAWLAAGDQRAARRLLESQPEDSPYLAAARVAWLLAAGRDHEAMTRGLALLELAGHTTRTRAETQTVAALAALRQCEREQAWSWLNGAAVAWETSGTRMHVALLDPRDRRVLWELAHERESRALERYLDVAASDARPVRLATAALTQREMVVLAALAEHDRVRALAEALFVSPHTVKSQLQSIYRKLGVSSRRSALVVARDLGLLDRVHPDA